MACSDFAACALCRWLQWLAGQEGLALGLAQAAGKLPLMPAGMPAPHRAPLILRLLFGALEAAATLRHALWTGFGHQLCPPDMSAV